MPRLIGALRFVVVAIAALFCIASLCAVATNAIPGWTIMVVIALLCVVVVGVVTLIRHPNGPFFEPLSILLPGLIIGRLLSTVWLIPAGQPVPKLSELILGETGPGVAYFEPLPSSLWLQCCFMYSRKRTVRSPPVRTALISALQIGW
jgi:hypothetical protein